MVRRVTEKVKNASKDADAAPKSAAAFVQRAPSRLRARLIPALPRRRRQVAGVRQPRPAATPTTPDAAVATGAQVARVPSPRPPGPGRARLFPAVCPPRRVDAGSSSCVGLPAESPAQQPRDTARPTRPQAAPQPAPAGARGATRGPARGAELVPPAAHPGPPSQAVSRPPRSVAPGRRPRRARPGVGPPVRTPRPGNSSGMGQSRPAGLAGQGRRPASGTPWPGAAGTDQRMPRLAVQRMRRTRR